MAGEAAGGTGGAGTAAAAGGSAGAAPAQGGAAAGAQPAAQAGAAGVQSSANTGAGAQAAGSASPAAADWTSGFNDDLKGYVQNKGWKDNTQVLDSYRNLEKLVGAPQEQILKLPKDGEAPEAWNSIYDRLGRPKSPDGYKLEIPKENGSPEFAKLASEQFHKLGLSEKQGQDLVKWWNGVQQGNQTASKEAYANKVAQDQTALKKEWGAAHDQNIAVAQRAAREFGVKAEVVSAIEKAVGFHETMKFFHTIGSKIGEATFHSGQPGASSGVMTPAQAKQQIKTLGGDPEFVKNYTAGQAKAREQMEALHKMAYPDAS